MREEELLLKELRERYRQDHFPRKLGVEIEELLSGYARVNMKVTGDMTNFHGITHGGAIFALADTAFGLASNTRGTAVALQMSVNFVKATGAGDFLTALAEEEYLTNSTGVYRITVSRGDETVALLRGTVFRKRQPGQIENER